MGAWHEGIYGNDDAQAFINVLMELAEEVEDLSDLIEIARDHPYTEFSNCRLVLSDLESNFFGEVREYSEFIRALEWELEPEQLNRWLDPGRRQMILEKFRQQMDQRLVPPNQGEDFTWQALYDWLEQKQQADVFESVV